MKDHHPAEAPVAWIHDAENYGNALNEAAWVFVEECPEKSALLFNNTKAPLRAGILKYAEVVAKAGKPDPEVTALREWKAEHQQFLTRLSVALVVDGNARQDAIEACVDELCARLARVRALADELERWPLQPFVNLTPMRQQDIAEFVAKLRAALEGSNAD